MTSARDTRHQDDDHGDEVEIPAGVEPGTVLAGKYRIERVLGAGGMGVVVHATHLMLNTPVAMKFLLPAFTQDSGIVARFLREAQAAVSLKNQHVASVIDVGTLETGSPYIVMEYLEGYDLHQLIDEIGPMKDFERVAILLLQACEGLASAHASGVVHRDVKPGNLFVAQDMAGQDQLKILDFGISKVEEQVTALTRTGTVMGSPMYMSPEQMRNSRGVDHRADIWSLGVVGFQLLTGGVPYDAETMTELIAQVLEEEPPRVTEFEPDVPPELDEVVARALKKNVAERYQSMADFAMDLAVFLGDEVSLGDARRIEKILGGMTSGHSLVGPLPTSPKSRSHITRRKSTLPAPPPEKSNKGKLIVGAIALLALLGVGAALTLGGSNEPPPEAAAQADVPAVHPEAITPTAPETATDEETANAAAPAPEATAAATADETDEAAQAAQAAADDADDAERASRSESSSGSSHRRRHSSSGASAPVMRARPADDIFGSRN